MGMKRDFPAFHRLATKGVDVSVGNKLPLGQLSPNGTALFQPSPSKGPRPNPILATLSTQQQCEGTSWRVKVNTVGIFSSTVATANTKDPCKFQPLVTVPSPLPSRYNLSRLGKQLTNDAWGYCNAIRISGNRLIKCSKFNWFN